MLFFSGQDPVAFTQQGESIKHVLGGKGAGLAEMTAAGVNVPPFVVIPTSVCQQYQQDRDCTIAGLRKWWPEIQTHFVEKLGYMPLLAVRSGARVSMPGMMDTILNIGLTTLVHDEWAARLGTDCLLDCRGRLEHMYTDVVKEPLPDAEDLQLFGAIDAVFRSWNNERAKTYRTLNAIPEDWGTAVVIQAMVFGNLGEDSATGVLFTRNPSTGENEVTGEFLVNAQGEDVVAGVRTPEPLARLADWNPHVAEQLLSQVMDLERHYRDMQDVEFTIQQGELFLLQTRTGKRTAQAALRIAHDLVEEGVVTEAEALKRISLKQYLKAKAHIIDHEFKIPATGKGIPASGGVVTGKAVFSSEEAVACKEPCILVSKETTPDDIAGMNAAVGILTAIGGATSHAAVVARGMDKTCVVGCTDLKPNQGAWFLNGKHVTGTITLNGDTGEIWVGVEVPVIDGDSNPYVAWVRETAWGVTQAKPVVNSITSEHGWVLTFDFDENPDKVLGMVKHPFGFLDLSPFSAIEPASFTKVRGVFGGTAKVEDPELKKAWIIRDYVTSGGSVKGTVVCSRKAAEILGDLNLSLVVQGHEPLHNLLNESTVVLNGVADHFDEETIHRVIDLRRKAGEDVDLISLGKMVPGAVLYTSEQALLRQVFAT